MTAAPTITAAAVSIIGRKRTAPASITASASGIPCFSRSSMKSTRMIELRTTIPAPAIKPIIEVAVKNAPINRVRRQNADQRERNRRHDRERRFERLKPADHQDVDQHQHGRERQPQIAEDFVGDVPLAIPFHRELVGAERLLRDVPFERRSLPAVSI